MRAIAIALFAFAGLLVFFAAKLGRNQEALDEGPAIPVRGFRRVANLTAIALSVAALALALYAAASCALGYPCFGLS